MSNERYIHVFIDWKPAEVIDPSRPMQLCMVGLLANHMNGVQELRPYKNTRGKDKKIKAARSIIDALETKEIEVDCIGIVGMTNGQFVNWACEGINRALKALGLVWDIKDSAPKKLKWNGFSFHLTEALGLSLYSQFLPLVGAQVAKICKDDKCRSVKLILDALPHSSEKGLALMNALREIPEVAQMWRANVEKGFNYQFGKLDTFINGEGVATAGKSHPNAILADWLVASCLANSNPQQVQSEGKFSNDEVQEIASVWRCAQRHRSAICIDVDNRDLNARVKASSRSSDSHFAA
jgi:hypothetical protein